MAELTVLEAKLAEVLGLAQAAQETVKQVRELVDDQGVAGKLEQMGEEAAEAERRCLEVAEDFEGKKTALQEKARETKSEANEMRKTYLGSDADALDGFEFLIMAEAGELGHVEIAKQLNEQKGLESVRELLEWNFEVQRRHFDTVRECALSLAASEDPDETE